MRDRAEIEELLALEALGGLEPDDRARLGLLLEERPEGREEIEEIRGEFADTAAMLGTGLPPAPLSADLEQRTVDAALAVPATAPAQRWRAALVAIAAAVILVTVGAIGGYLAAPPSDFEAFMEQPDVQLIPFERSEGASGTMTLAVGPDGRSAYVLGSGLEAPSSGDVYELWTIQGETPTSLGCVIPTDGNLLQPVTGSFGTADVAAMTVEGSACPPAPTTDPVQVATL